MIIVRPTRIAEMRRRAHLRQLDLAELCGISQQHLSRIELGQQKECSDDVAHMLTQHLGLNFSAVFKEHADDVQRVRLSRSELEERVAS